MTLTMLLIAAVLAAGGNSPTKPISLVMMTTSDGAELRWSVTDSQFASVPTWHPEDGEPVPFSLRLAIDLARDSVRKRNPEISEFALSNIKMCRGDHPYEDRWYYLIQFRPVVGGRPMIGGLYVGCVLMNGTLVEPETGKRDGTGR